ncbi:MAG: metallophosphoesterase [Marinilabiliaceae bacterium]|nr:metallophosphoesterase [Marinilabiliaceae bacterium]
MKKEILIVPDIHGRDFWLPALDYEGEVIFLGDYTDPYPQEGFTEEDAYQGLLKIIEFKKQNPDRVTLLIGNHELHYYNREFLAGRYNDKYAEKYKELLTCDENKNLFQICRQIDNYLIIHAGLTKGWYDLHYNEFKDLGATLEEQLNKIFFEKMYIFHEAAWEYRGGFHDAGSPLWADINEIWDEKEHFAPDIIQIVGHTQIIKPEPIIKDAVWLIDTKQLYLFKDNKIEKFIKV